MLLYSFYLSMNTNENGGGGKMMMMAMMVVNRFDLIQ
jgi:hypothetical protein